MSRFFSKKFSALTPYTPGEQPRDKKYIKLNTNESPFPPSPGVIRAVLEEAATLQLYSDPECTVLINKLAEVYGAEPERIIATNGSDEVLDFAFNAFCDKENPIVFPDITYGFYSVFAEKLGIPYEEIPLKDDLTVDVNDYIGINKNIVIANPNAPTGIALPLSDIERIVASNPDNVVIIDEAYVDFGGESAVKLTEKYGNLLVVQTFSKSRSLAGARLGFAIGSKELISDLHTLRYSTNPYNVNRMTCAAGYAALTENGYYMQNAQTVMRTREFAKAELEKRGFTVLPSKANFLFAKSGEISGEELYLELKELGVLVRHFKKERIKDYCRITVGTAMEMKKLLDNIDIILEKRT
ncbi:MAG: histidinol-phosphate transaminase [Ruminococcaceae bacterium]|nr:histidinol-phosphate transaminase [Oscillospiraceae bacterium]